MEEGAGSTIFDSSGNNYNLSIQGSSNWSPDIPPTSNPDTQSVIFDGSSFANLVNSAHNLAFDFTTGFTIEVWVKISTSQVHNDPGIISKWNGSGYLLWNPGGGGISKAESLFNGGPPLASTSIIRDNNWHYLAMSWDGFVQRVYIDGVEETSQEWTAIPNSSGIDFVLGTYGGSLGNAFTGNMDEVKIYKVARTQTEIQSDAGIIVVPTATPTVTPTSTLTPIPTTPTPTLTPTPSETPAPTISPTPTNTPTPTPTPITGLVAYWKIEEGTGGTFIDSSGNNRSIFISGAKDSLWETDTPPTYVAPDTKSFHFDGTNYGLLSSPGDNTVFNLPAGFTIEVWVKESSTQITDPGIISKWDGNGYLLWAPSGTVETKINGEFLPSGSFLKDDNWHHLAMTWDGTEQKIYIDGVIKGSQAPGILPNSVNSSLLLATYSFGQPQFIGNMDEIKVWNHARTEAQIREDGGVIVIPTSTPTSSPTPTSTLTPTPTIGLGSVVINEIMWSGSTPHPSDEWIELKNMTSSPIDLTNWVVENLGDSGSPGITIPSGIIGADNYFLISNKDKDNSIINVDSDYVTTAISLLDDGEQLTLKNNSGTTIDIANQIGNWFFGLNGIPSKSMSRKSPPSDGTVGSNWFTSTGSINLDSVASESATPKADNI